MIYCVQSSVRISVDGWKVNYCRKPFLLSSIDPNWWWSYHDVSETDIIVISHITMSWSRDKNLPIINYSQKFSNLINNPLRSSGYFINQISHSSLEIAKKNLNFAKQPPFATLRLVWLHFVVTGYLAEFYQTICQPEFRI